MRGGHSPFPSPPAGGEGRAAPAAKGEGSGLAPSSPSPWLGFASPFPLPLKGARGWGVSAEGDEDRSQDAVEVRHDVRVGKADHPIASCFEGARAGGVVGLRFAMGVPVELDDETFGARGEVGDVGREDNLALEFDAEAIGAKPVPETALGLGQVGAQGFRADSRFDVPFHLAAPSPRSASRSRPLPLKGARGSGRHLFNSFESDQTVNA